MIQESGPMPRMEIVPARRSGCVGIAKYSADVVRGVDTGASASGQDRRSNSRPAGARCFVASHYLTPIFEPETIAVFGVSDRPASVGGRVFGNLIESGFPGLFAINPKHQSVQGRPCYADIGAVEGSVDLAIIATPARTVPDIIDSCGQRGVRSAVILSAGFGEAGPEGVKLQARVMEVARYHRMRLLGPNCLGVIRPSIGMNATFSKGGARDGELALVSQSGALCTAILDWADAREIGFSSVVSLGAAADVGFGELLDFLAHDPKTRSILLYVEGVQHSRAFMSGLRAAARLKPVIVIKAGRHEAGSRAAVSHTGALVGSDDVFDAALERAGVVRAITIDELFAATNILARGCRTRGNRLAIVTNGGGPGVLAADRAVELNVDIVRLSDSTIESLDKRLPSHWSRANPVDVLGDADCTRYESALEAVLEDERVDGVLTILTPQAMTDPEEIASSVTVAAKKHPDKPTLACWMGSDHVDGAHRLFDGAGIPSYHAPEDAVAGFAYLANYHNNQRLLLETPGPLADTERPDFGTARRIVRDALAEGRDQLSSLESKELLDAFRIPVIQTKFASSAEGAASAANAVGYPVVMKISSKDVSHKSDVGGVALNLAGSEQVREMFQTMLDRVGELVPGAKIDGVTIERQWQPSHARELLIGVINDAAFGPAITFGAGGTTVEILKDRAVALPPLNELVIRNMIANTRVSRLLYQFRDLPPIDWPSLENALLRISEMVCDFPEIRELDINPLIGAPEGTMALDARVVLQSAENNGDRYAHMAIHPYPHELVRETELETGETITLRPIRPEDAEIERDFVNRLSPDSKYFRFMGTLQELTPEMLARFTQIDYDQEMAFIATSDAREIGVARYIAEPDGQSCEFAIVVADGWQGKGIGTQLMDALIAHARSRRLSEMHGEVLSNNYAMLDLVGRLGFVSKVKGDDPSVNQVAKTL